ncbi:hypothetical protein F2Q69_00014879 [Brassica cretica]|uniref:Uncharacterized protein n=1 Tax=Brassica cretica TaxID=69181 RepID=A0A8S9QX02_BRACR|nr:hypothetical protein F2Q69_00014879 [Brassica cretica]
MMESLWKFQLLLQPPHTRSRLDRVAFFFTQPRVLCLSLSTLLNRRHCLDPSGFFFRSWQDSELLVSTPTSPSPMDLSLALSMSKTPPLFIFELPYQDDHDRVENDQGQLLDAIDEHTFFLKRKTSHPPSPFYVKIDRPNEPAIDRQRETDIDRHPSPPIDRRAPLTYRVRLPSIDSNRINALRPPPKPLANPQETTPNPSDTTPEPIQVDEATEGRLLRKRKDKISKHLKREATEKEMDVRIVRQQVNVVELENDLGYIAACHCGAEYETEYSESIDTHTVTSIDSNESPTTDELYPMLLDGMQPVDYSTSLDQYYPDFSFQQPNKNGRDDYSIGSWAERGFHESFAVETVILSSNEDPTEEYDED